MKYLKIIILFIISSFLIFNISCGNEEKPQDNEKIVEPQKEEDIYYNIVFKDSDGSIIKNIKVKKGDKIEYPEDPIPSSLEYKFKEWRLTIKSQ